MSYNDLTAHVSVRIATNPEESKSPNITSKSRERGTASGTGRGVCEKDQVGRVESVESTVVESSSKTTGVVVDDDDDAGAFRSSSKALTATPVEKYPSDGANTKKTDMQDCEHGEDGIDRNMPAAEIGRKTIKLLSDYLRPPKVNAKDWQDMAEEMGFNYQREIQVFKLQPKPVEEVITNWSTKRGSTVGKLLDILEDIERDDVLLKLPPLLAADCKRWRRRQDEANDPVQVPEVSGNYPVQLATEELRGITVGDHPSGPPEVFDAYVCFADPDYGFVQELIGKLESPPSCFKLCIDHRDLVPGGSHAIVTAEIIQNRCKKMLVILSPEFLQSSSCDFQTKFAVSLEPGARKKRIIPVLVKPCVPPVIIRHITTCDFTRRDLQPWLWERLRKAIAMP